MFFLILVLIYGIMHLVVVILHFNWILYFFLLRGDTDQGLDKSRIRMDCECWRRGWCV